MPGLKTLVVLPNWVGDTVMAQPVLESLAASARQVHALAKPHLLPLLEIFPRIAGTVRRGATDAQTVAAIAALAPDEAVVLPNSFRSAWWVHRARVPRRWGYRGDLRRLLLRPSVKRPPRPGRRPHRDSTRHQINDYERLLAAMGADPVGNRSPRLEPRPVDRDRADRSLDEAGLPPARGPLVGLFAGAAFGPSKRWPAERFTALSRRLAGLDPAPRVVLVAGPGEVELARSIARRNERPPPILGPDLDLAALAAVLARLSLLVTNDSGPMHLAAAVGTRCIALFGPTDPRRTAPSGSDHETVWTSRWCSPCFRRRCPLLHHRCLRDIEVEEVLRIAASALARESG